MCSRKTGVKADDVTDADGSFSFDDLPAGRYDVRGSKARYVDTALGARGPNRPGRPVDLADGQKIESLTLTLPAAGVITGRVFDDVGDVVPGAQVMAMRYRSINGERQLVPLGRSAQADDTGTFRLFGLAPGSYYVSTAPKKVSADRRVDDGARDGLARPTSRHHGRERPSRSRRGRR